MHALAKSCPYACMEAAEARLERVRVAVGHEANHGKPGLPFGHPQPPSRCFPSTSGASQTSQGKCSGNVASRFAVGACDASSGGKRGDQFLKREAPLPVLRQSGRGSKRAWPKLLGQEASAASEKGVRVRRSAVTIAAALV